VRFGNFQIHAAHKENDALKRLADYVITTHYPHLGAPSRDAYVQWLHEVCRRTARMIVGWMRVGFVHGVMNTDNMSILGVTIDYGPYGWLEDFDPSWTPNTTDAQGRRYAYGNQPQIAQWNLLQLANALYPLLNEKEPLEEGLKIYADVFQAEWPAAVAQKLGLTAPAQSGDDELQADLFKLLTEVETDFTILFRALARVPTESDPAAISDAALIEPLKPAFYDENAASAPAYVHTLASWLRRYVARVQSDTAPAATRAERMNRVNPKYVLRNYMAQLAIDGLVQDDPSVMERMMRVLKNPYDEQPGNDDLAERRPEWARNRAGCSALS
jgi:serine/tyrosine/threonine adenylyltransferase